MKAAARGFSGAKRACMKEIHKLVEGNWAWLANCFARNPVHKQKGLAIFFASPFCWRNHGLKKGNCQARAK